MTYNGEDSCKPKTKVLTCECNMETTVYDFMFQQIQTKTGIPVDQQRLICFGKELDINKLMYFDYGIGRWTVVYLIFRLKACSC
jgi:hypothetical protein